MSSDGTPRPWRFQPLLEHLMSLSCLPISSVYFRPQDLATEAGKTFLRQIWSLNAQSGKAVLVDLESLKREIRAEIQRLDHRRATLLERMVHLKALEEGRIFERRTTGSEESPHLPSAKSDQEDMLAALRCLKCGASLRNLIPTNTRGEPSLGSPRLGKSDGHSRYLECPQCQARNVFVRTTGPHGWRLLVTQLKQ